MGDAIRPHLFDAADGTAALPSYTFLNDRDTGFYRAASDQLGVTLGGAAKLLYSAGAFAFQEATVVSALGAITVQTRNAAAALTTRLTVADSADTASITWNNQQTLFATTGTPPAPDSIVHIWNATAGTIAANANTLLTLENNTDCFLSILTPNTNQAGLLIGDPESALAAVWIYRHNTNDWRLDISAGTRLVYGAGAFAFQEATTISTTVGDLTLTPTGNVALGAKNITMTGTIAATGARVTNIFTTSQTTTNAETVDSWGMTKQHIVPYEDALAVLRGISVVAYEHKSAFDPSGRRKLGVLAESINERLVTPFDDYVGLGPGPRLDMLGLAAINTRAIQQVDDEVETLRARVAFLEGRLKFLEVGNAQDPD